MVACDIYFESPLSIQQQLKLLKPLFQVWIGDDYEQYYLPEINYFSYRPGNAGFLINIEYNSSYNKTDEDCDLFRYALGYIDMDGRFPDSENILRISATLKLLWSNNIPTCTPGCSEILPLKGGEEGPIPWPKHGA